LFNFEFIACNKNVTSLLVINDRFSFENLDINIDSHYFDASIYKVFNQSNFEVDFIGISDNANLPYTCTLFLTEELRTRISIVGNRKFIKLIHDAVNNTNQCFHLVIFDATLLEKYCFNLLRGSSSRNFITTIDIFKLAK
jgi:hypothetical protein